MFSLTSEIDAIGQLHAPPSFMLEKITRWYPSDRTPRLGLKPCLCAGKNIGLHTVVFNKSKTVPCTAVPWIC